MVSQQTWHPDDVQQPTPGGAHASLSHLSDTTPRDKRLGGGRGRATLATQSREPPQARVRPSLVQTALHSHNTHTGAMAFMAPQQVLPQVSGCCQPRLASRHSAGGPTRRVAHHMQRLVAHASAAKPEPAAAAKVCYCPSLPVCGCFGRLPPRLPATRLPWEHPCAVALHASPYGEATAAL